jgi:flagellar hook-length control protein FliK
MKEPEIVSVKSPQSQPKTANKASSSNLSENSSFEKKLNDSSKRLENDDSQIMAIMGMLAGMSSLPPEKRAEAVKYSGSGMFSDKERNDFSLSDILGSIRTSSSAGAGGSRNDNAASGNTPSAELEKQDTQQALIAQLLAYFKNSGVPFPVMDLVSRLENMSAKPDIGQIAQKIIDNANLIKIKGKTELVLNLKPQWLGDLKMSISSDNGTLTIQIFANEKTKQLIESQMEELKSLLAGADLNVGSLNVSVGGRDTGKDGTEEGIGGDAAAAGIPVSFLRQAKGLDDARNGSENIAMTMRRLMIYSKV